MVRPLLRFDQHALARMAERGISALEVAEALADRETSYPSRRRPDRLVILGRTLADRRLKIVVEAADERFVWTVADRDKEN
ncbi:MAG TPA: DUF4258 domain-containing protein [Acidimicrobiia bacterium]|nr:DUF4258 domain-containing protein [Acidimicrobiia bacterium]